MKKLNDRAYASPEALEIVISLEDKVCLMSSNAEGKGFTFGQVEQNDSFNDTEWI